ncbi:MAG: adenylyl-sulfate kinase [Ornithinimicrobium sp.]
MVDLCVESPEKQVPSRSGAVLLFTGLSGSGKSTLARSLRNRLLERSDKSVTLLDGDVVRRHLSAGLGFSLADRDVNVRRIGWVGAQVAEHGGLAICSPIAPFETTRQAVRDMTRAAGGQFMLIHVATPLEECERRDRKGLYARARRGEIADFTGISSPYEEPLNPDLRIDTTGEDIKAVTEHILRIGAQRQMWPTLAAPSEQASQTGDARS